jgi:hypothetical protein
MDIKTRLTRCCGKPVGGDNCREGLRCSDCFDKLEAWREIEQLQLALGAMVSAYDYDWEVGDAVVRCRKIMADGQKPWDEIERLNAIIKEQNEEIEKLRKENELYR